MTELQAQCNNTVTSFPYSEGFESGSGLWSQGTGDDFNWTRDSGGTPSTNTGPSSGTSGTTWYMFTEASTPNYPSRVAILDGPCFDISDSSNEAAIFGFDYHMYGSDVGILKIEASTDGSSWSTINTLRGNHGFSWITCAIDLSSYIGDIVHIRFHATTGASSTGWSSDIALDNITFTTPSYNSLCVTTISNFPYSESFESGLGDWTQDVCDDINWTRDSGGTPSNSTGPSTGSNSSIWYLFTEASNPNFPSRSAIISGPCFDLVGCLDSAIFSFDYHMRGANVGTLDLQIASEGSGWVSLESYSENLGNTWNSHTESLSDYLGQKIRLRFLATTGPSSSNGWSSDIAIDNMSLITYEQPLVDTDSDGISDVVDIDDDNDGIPDTYENGELPSPFGDLFITNGDASEISSSEIQLVPAVLSQAGSAFATQKISFECSFVYEFEAYLGTNTINGADGIGIVFHNDPDTTAAIGTRGQGLGAAGLENGIVLELDIWDNGVGADVGDISNDHGMIWDSDDQNSSLTTAVSFGELEDGLWHDVQIYWDAECMKILYSVDDLVGAVFTGDLVNDYFGGASEVFFGFTASSGGAFNDQRVRITNGLSVVGSCLDTDGDGVKDQYDLDSDNDGIWDASEAGHGELVTSGMLSGSVGSNGLIDAIETSTDSDIINYTIADSESAPDGIFDAHETDADDDGCYDTLEEEVPDSDEDGIAGAGSATVNSVGEVIAISYVVPSSSKWQNPNNTSACNDNRRIWINPFVTRKVKRN